MQQKIRAFALALAAFLRKNAYGVTLSVCLAVIVGTAVYVRWPQEQTPPEENIAADAPDKQVDRLADVLKAPEAQTTMHPPAETAAPLSMAYALSMPGCVWPLEGAVSREHSAQKLIYMPTMERYETHSGVDIAGEPGVQVVAPMSGTIKSVGTHALWGGSVVITHPDGLESTIHGVKAAGALRSGLAVRTGEGIGTLEEAIPYERREGAHIHWSLTRDGVPVDPRQMIR